MKRAQFLFNQIVSYENLRTAWLKARRHKGRKRSVINYHKNVEANLNDLQKKLLSRDFNFPTYHQFTVYDPKIRTISVVPFDQRVLHHAIINVLEPVFEKQFIFHTYACRKGKGVHKALQNLQKQMRKPELKDGYYIKLDVRKYFENIDHWILKIKLSRIIKDSDCLELLFSLIDSFYVADSVVFEECKNCESKKGLPIGNLTSQFFANLYLSDFDHLITEKFHASGYVRYMDDMVILCKNYMGVRKLLFWVNDYFNKELYLELKAPVINKCRNGIPFLGRIVYQKNIRFLSLKIHRKKLKFLKKQYVYTRGFISDDKFIDEILLISRERVI